jgi:DNA-binding NarL/FixJ family response regulator
MAAAKSVLFVDDEPHLLDGIARAFRHQFPISTATSGADGLKLLHEGGPFAVVVSDMRMPQMNGVEFLTKVRERSPDSVRMILSGQADLAQTIAAVNEGNIFRFLSKPCPPDALLRAVTTALEQYRLVIAERELLQHTLTGAVHMLLEMLSLTAPLALARARRLQRYVTQLTTALKLAEDWQWPLAAELSQIGCVSLPKETLASIEAGQELTEEERRLFDCHPQMAAKMLEAIPRLENIAAIVAAQNSPLGDKEIYGDIARQDARSIGRILLRGAIEFERESSDGRAPAAVVTALKALKPPALPASVIEAMCSLSNSTQQASMRFVGVLDLAPGMVLDEPLLTQKGAVLVPADQEITQNLLARLRGLHSSIHIKEPVRVRSST